MLSIKKLPLTVLILMTIVSFTNLFGLDLSWAAIILGVVFFFINQIVERQPMKGSGLDLKAIGTGLKSGRVWIWIALPLVMDAICVAISLFFLPEYIAYETVRAGSFVPVEISVSSVLLFFVFALGEEIAWRAFFQNQLSKSMPAAAVLLISSLLFTSGHFQQGNTIVVAYGLVFTFINSILCGVIFHKTKNAWISTISHFAANIFEVILFVIIQN